MATATVGEARLGEHGLKLMGRGDPTDPSRVVAEYKNTFTSFNDENWDITGTNPGTPTLMDKVGGWINAPTSGTINDDIYLSNKGEAFLFNATDELSFKARVEHNHVGTVLKSSFVIGLSDTVSNDFVVDAGTIATSFDGACFILQEDGTALNFISSNATTQVTDSGVGGWEDGDIAELGFYYHPNDGVTGKIIVTYDRTAVARQDITISGLAEMHFVFGGKTHVGSAQTGPEIDWVHIIQRTAASVV